MENIIFNTIQKNSISVSTYINIGKLFSRKVLFSRYSKYKCSSKLDTRVMVINKQKNFIQVLNKRNLKYSFLDTLFEKLK